MLGAPVRHLRDARLWQEVLYRRDLSFFLLSGARISIGASAGFHHYDAADDDKDDMDEDEEYGQ